MSDKLVHDFGVLPDSVMIWNGGPTRDFIEFKVRFHLELWRVERGFELRHNRQILNLGLPDDSQFLKIVGMRPAKGMGFCELRFGAKIVEFPAVLFEGRYENLSWMQSVACRLGKLLSVAVIEHDMGSDC